jgi:hypothetical protein
MYTTGQHQQNRVAAALGYKITEGEPATNFLQGDNIIILTKKGEPVMSGEISKLVMTPNGIVFTVGGNEYGESLYQFRRM